MSIISQAEVHTLPTGQATANQILIHHTWGPNSIANYACDLIKSAVMSPTPAAPEVLVDRCIAIAELAFQKFEQKGWLVELPSWEQLNEGGPGKAGFVQNG